MAGTIEARMSQIKSRINYKLSALRDEAILDARAADQRKVAVHQAVVVALNPRRRLQGCFPISGLFGYGTRARNGSGMVVAVSAPVS